MPTCAQCGATRHVVACECCGEPVCPACKAPSTSDNAEMFSFSVYCSVDCRDGTAMRVAMKTVDCPKCNGTGKRRAWNDPRKKVDCYRCGGTGKCLPDQDQSAPKARKGYELVTCPDCGGRYEFNCATCETCNGKGTVERKVGKRAG